MHEHLSRCPNLLIVSDTAMRLVNNESHEAFEPVVREIENIQHLFNSITWIGYNYTKDLSRSNLRGIDSNKINYILLERTGGNRLSDKLNILLKVIPYFIIIFKAIKKNNLIHTRAPSFPAFLAIIGSIFLKKKKYWHKYAGNWNQKNAPFSYSIQRSLLNIKIGNSKVTINGAWPSQKQHMLSFENPCLSDKELASAKLIAEQKCYSEKLNLCLKVDSSRMEAYSSIIAYYASNNNFKKAKEYVDKGIETNKSSSILYEMGGKLLLQEFQLLKDNVDLLHQAEQMYLKAIALSDEKGAIKKQLIFVYIDMGENQKAISIANELLNIYYDDPDLYFNVGVLYQRLATDLYDPTAEAYVKLNAEETPDPDMVVQIHKNLNHNF